MHRFLRVALFVVMCLSMAESGSAQVATGAYPYGTFDSKGIDTINVGNLNVSLRIPVINKPGRGMAFEYSLLYNSSVWTNSVVSGSHVWTPAPLFGWAADTEASTGNVTYATTTATYNETGGAGGTFPKCTVNTYTNFVYFDPLGTAHLFNSQTQQIVRDDGANCPVSSSPNFTETAIDGSGYSISVLIFKKSTITAPNGKVLLPYQVGSTGVVQDANGNKITLDASGNFTDTTGHVALTVAGSSPGPHTFTYKDTTGTSQTVTMSYVSKSVQTHFGCSGVGEYGPTATYLVDAITFPDGSGYHFTYEATPGVTGKVTGRISGVQLPQGGTISYSYSGGSNGITCSDGSTSALTRSLAGDSGSAASFWSYSRSSAGANLSHTDVVDGLGNNLAYDFVQPSNLPTGSSAAIYYETNRKVYQGAVTTTPVLARVTCYNTEAVSCTTTPISLPVQNINVSENLDGIATRGSTTVFNGYGAVTQRELYDFGTPPSVGGILSNEVWIYGGSIPVYPTEHDVKDGSGNLAGKTTYVYDTPAATASLGVPQHVVPTVPPGNLTKISQYANSSVSYVSTATYEDTGSILTVTTPNGTVTPTWDSTFTYATKVAYPTPSSATAISAGGTYDQTYTGLPVTSVDPNTNSSTMKYDTLLRLKELDSPDGGKTTWAITPTQTSTYTYQTSTTHTDTETQYDGYGRQSRVAVANGQSTNPWYQQDTCYDANGNVSFVSYRYQSTGLTSSSKVCSGAGDTYTYDVLGRVKSITRSNGEAIGYLYTARATRVTDENSVQRVTQVDGLGRIKTACEISSSTLQGVASMTCGTDITGTGFTTTYSYALATGTTTVNQGGQVRTFVNDWLGRPSSTTEPESGTTSYTYAYNTTGLVVTRKKPRANQTSSFVLTTTTTQYDSLGRVTTISYDDGTGTRNYSYDKPTWSNYTQNLKGRLAMAYMTTPGITYGVSTGYSYDAVGRVVKQGQCTPSTCGTGGYDLAYTYDLAGNMLTSTDGGSATSTYTVSIANEPLTLISSVNNTNNPGSLISAVQNGPNGPATYSLGNGLSQYIAYDALGRLYGGWVCSGTPSFACPVQAYGFDVNPISGSQIKLASDNITGQGTVYSYDEFNRLKSTMSGNGLQGFAYVYDRYGNRVQQNVTAGTGPHPIYSFNANNQITGSGYAYDAAGNMTNDGFHTYTYDAEGNITKVDGSSTAAYVYNALGQRVQIATSTGSTDFVFDASGRRVSTWNASTHAQSGGQYYWAGKPVAYYSGGATHFQHQDWLGTERVRTTATGSVEGTYTSLPFGDAQTPSGTDGNQYHFAALDYDSESSTDHAQFRQYSSTQGRWMRPDPYSGSYDFGNPQSLNRYTYVLNNPMSMIDPAGLTACFYGGKGDTVENDADPTDFESVPTEQDCVDNGGIPLTAGTTVTVNANTNAYQFSFSFGPGTSLLPFQPVPPPIKVHGLWTYGNYCGTGGSGQAIDGLDVACRNHDTCYANGNYSARQNLSGSDAGLQACNQALCDAAWSIMQRANSGQLPRDEGEAAFDVVSYFGGFSNIVTNGNRCKLPISQ